MSKTRTQTVLILDLIRASVPNPDLKTELDYETPFQLMIAVILSAQTTDKQVNRITPALFSRIREPKDVMALDITEIEEYVKYVNYYRNKSKFIKNCGEILARDYDGVIPNDFTALNALPGIGIKTAKVILSVLFDAPLVAVDTHVHRICNRIGLVTTKMPEQTDKALDLIFSTEQKKKAHHAMVLFGRYTCVARKPKCEICRLQEYCKFYQKLLKSKSSK